MRATDAPLGIVLRNIRIHSASFGCIKRFSILCMCNVYLLVSFSYNSAFWLSKFVGQSLTNNNRLKII